MSSHAHPHAGTSDTGDAMPGYYEIMETAVRELLVEKIVIGVEEIRQMLEVMDTRTPALGSKIVLARSDLGNPPAFDHTDWLAITDSRSIGTTDTFAMTI